MLIKGLVALLVSFCLLDAIWASLRDAVNAEQSWIQAVRRHLHQYPELLYEEEKTSEIIRSYLDEVGVSYKYPIAKTGIVATIGQGSPVVALRADIDALPVHEPEGLPFRSKNDGRMHACGHDSHMAMLLGAGKVLKANEAALNGTVRLIFQPAEEGGAGARQMIKEGVLEGVDGIFGVHNWPTMPIGHVGSRASTLMAGSAEFAVTIVGRGGHAALPQGNIDPIIPTAALVTAFQTIVSRATSPLDSIVISVTQLAGGDAFNVTPERARLGGTLRALRPDTLDATIERMTAMAHGVAAAHGCTAEVSWGGNRPVYPPTVNDAGAWDFVKGVAAGIFGADNVEDIEPIMPAEDFSFFLQKIPGAFVFVGHEDPAKGSSAALHNPNFMLNEDILPMGAALLTDVATQFLNQGGFKGASGGGVKGSCGRDEL
eukprot:jgi/Ulvmu1/11669/UM008_0078.1